ncbi:hypothetical protein LJ737_11075 [Hymenobacter sp. 15J16-1T3B]|uniref:YncE family protein n=1 Tax=Hymenobacter sp. 15J16-1T3B TaxID=2886941 RepID=UPI001D1189F2|nr:DUF5074 domain-containing protein [Hymenobacter sp. 15J16-1T3B]MCC3157781.1 hypothetical protein [Hymenobacter sp. 15J16-1T3B]
MHFSPLASRLRPLLTLPLAAALLSSCGKDETEKKTLDANVYVLNQGQYGTPNGSVSGYRRDTKESEKDQFERANGRTVGDVVQSMTVVGDKGYVVVNNSSKVEVVALPKFNAVATISGRSQPRYLAVNGSTGYLTEWQGPFTGYLPGRVSVIDLATNTVASTVTVGRNPEKALVAGTKLFVPNSDENTVSVVDLATKQVEATLTVAAGPNSLVQDASGNVWLACGGITRYSGGVVSSREPGALIRFSATTPYTSQATWAFASGGPSNLQASSDRTALYYSYGGAVYRMATTATALPTAPVLRRSFNGFGIDPTNNELYIATGSFSADGRAVRYSSTFAPVDSFAVGIGASAFSFR